MSDSRKHYSYEQVLFSELVQKTQVYHNLLCLHKDETSSLISILKNNNNWIAQILTYDYVHLIGRTHNSPALNSRHWLIWCCCVNYKYKCMFYFNLIYVFPQFLFPWSFV